MLAFACLISSLPAQTKAVDVAASATPFLGESSCSSSSCHGGAGEKRGQCVFFSKFDVHTRSYATLTLARSARIADVLKIGDPVQSARCTVCHAPFQSIATNAALQKTLDPAAGVSCESCHGAAENWLLSHTRKDFTHQDRVNIGMRDLNNLYVRANTCVACHQNVDADILQAGHPELIFELDGQAVAEPKHWREGTNWSGAQAWIVGQAVALREMSWQLYKESDGNTDVIWQLNHGSQSIKNDLLRWNALETLLREAVPYGLRTSVADEVQRKGNVYLSAQEFADKIALKLAGENWSSEKTHSCLNILADESQVFRQTSPFKEGGRIAERLVLALDRLVTSLNDETLAKKLDAPLNQLFKDAQSLPDFNPEIFAADLDSFDKALQAARK